MDAATKSAALSANITASPKWFSVQIAAAFGTISAAFFAWLASIPVDQQIAFATSLLTRYSWGLPLIPIIGFGLRYWARVHPQTPPAEPQSPAAEAIEEAAASTEQSAAPITPTPPPPHGEGPISL